MTISLLRKCPLLKALPTHKLRKVLRFSRSMQFAAGTHIFDKTDLAQHMFIVESGRVRIYIASDTRKRKTFDYLGPGDFFGEMALLDAQERSASAEAIEDCRLRIIHKRDFKRFLLCDPALCFQLLCTLSMRLRSANEQIEALLFRNVLGRVTKALHDLGKRGGQRFRGGLLIPTLRNRQELADLVGTTREPLSRALGTLKRAQLIRFHHGLIHLRDLQRIAALATARPAGPGN